MKRNFLKTALAAALFAVAGGQTAVAQEGIDDNGWHYQLQNTPSGYYYFIAGWNNNLAIAPNAALTAVTTAFDISNDANNLLFVWYWDADNKNIYWGPKAWNKYVGDPNSNSNVQIPTLGTSNGNKGALAFTNTDNSIGRGFRLRYNNSRDVSVSYTGTYADGGGSQVNAPLNTFGNRWRDNEAAGFRFAPVDDDIVTAIESYSADDVFSGQAITTLSDIDDMTNAFFISTNGRQGFVAKDDASGLQGTGDDAHRLFYLIKKAGSTNRYYFYNEALGKFLTRDLTLTDRGDAFEISASANPDGDYRWAFKFDDDHNINNSGNANAASYKVSNYSSPDAGNRFKIGVPVNIVGRTYTKKAEAQTKVSAFKDITYNAVYNGDVVKSSIVTHVVGDSRAVPADFTSIPFCDFSYDVETIEAGTAEVNVTVTWQSTAPYKLTTKAAPRYYTWQDKAGSSIYASDEDQLNDQGNDNASDGNYTPMYGKTGKVVHIASDYKTDDNYQWAFVGNPYEIEIINKAYPGKYLMFRNKLSGNSGNAQLLLFDEDTDGDDIPDYIYYWKIVENNSGDNKYIGLNNGNNFWVRNDAGNLNDVQCPGLQNGSQVSNGAVDKCRFTVTEIVPSYDVTYEAWYNDIKLKDVVVATKEGTAPAIPAGLNAAYTALALDESAPDAVMNDVTIKVNASWNPPFTTEIWYNLGLRPNEVRYASTETNDAGQYLVQQGATEYKRTLDAFQWKITGNPYEVQVVAKDGKVVTLNNDDNFATLEEDGTFKFELVRVDDTTFRLMGIGIDGDNKYLADYQNPGKLGRWAADDGTKIQVVAIPEAPANVALTVTAAGYATFASQWPLDFTDVTAVKAYRAVKNGDNIEFAQVTGAVPAEEGLLIKGTKDEVVNATVPVAESAIAIDNELVGVLVDTKLDAGIFVLMNGTSGVGFYRTTNEEGFTVRANSAYLPASVAAGARTFIGFSDDTTTGIANVNVNENDNRVFDMQGRRVAQPTKGLYIQNGKKIVVK